MEPNPTQTQNTVDSSDQNAHLNYIPDPNIYSYTNPTQPEQINQPQLLSQLNPTLPQVQNMPNNVQQYNSGLPTSVSANNTGILTTQDVNQNVGNPTDLTNVNIKTQNLANLDMIQPGNLSNFQPLPMPGSFDLNTLGNLNSFNANPNIPISSASMPNMTGLTNMPSVQPLTNVNMSNVNVMPMNQVTEDVSKVKEEPTNVQTNHSIDLSNVSTSIPNLNQVSNLPTLPALPNPMNFAAGLPAGLAGLNGTGLVGNLPAMNTSFLSAHGFTNPYLHHPSLALKHFKNQHNANNQLNNFTKPPYSYSCLIALALRDAPRRQLKVGDIYIWIETVFPWYKKAPQAWRNSVRHNLSLNKAFEKVPDENAPPPGLGVVAPSFLGFLGSSRKGCEWRLIAEKSRKVFEEILRNVQKNSDAVKKAMSRPDLFDSHHEKVKAELAYCIRAAREGRAAAAANARAVAAAARNFPVGFGGGFPMPGFPLLRPGMMPIEGYPAAVSSAGQLWFLVL